jgi:hypothetical protein
MSGSGKKAGQLHENKQSIFLLASFECIAHKGELDKLRIIPVRRGMRIPRLLINRSDFIIILC